MCALVSCFTVTHSGPHECLKELCDVDLEQQGSQICILCFSGDMWVSQHLQYWISWNCVASLLHFHPVLLMLDRFLIAGGQGWAKSQEITTNLDHLSLSPVNYRQAMKYVWVSKLILTWSNVDFIKLPVNKWQFLGLYFSWEVP